MSRSAKYDILYVSPHLDDVALSCSARILTEKKEGKKILVLTIFSRGDDSEARRQEYAERRAEDREAMRRLGVDYLWLDFADAPVRCGAYSSFQNMHFAFFDFDEHTRLEIHKRLREIWNAAKPEEIVLPLGAGSHIDHRLAFSAFSVIPPSTTVSFYEDRPYAFVEEAVELRFREIGCCAPTSYDRKQIRRFLESFNKTYFYSQHPPQGSLARFRALLSFCRGFCRGYANNFKQQKVIGIKMIEPVCHIVAAYPSQIKGLFGSLSRYAADCGVYARRLGTAAPYAERYWHFNDS